MRKALVALFLAGIPATAFAQATPQSANTLGSASAWTDSTQLVACQSVGGCDQSLSKPLVLGTALQNSVYIFTKMSGDFTVNSSGVGTINNLAVTTAKLNTAAVTYAKLQNETGLTLLGNPTGAPASPAEITLGTNLSFAGTVLNATAGSATAVESIGAFGGIANAYTMASPAPAVSANTAHYRACGTFPATIPTNTGASTLAVGTAAALPIRKNTIAGLVALTSGDITAQVQSTCFELDGTASFWVMQVVPLSTTKTDFNGSVTTPDWTTGTNYRYVTAGQTLTLPSASGLSPNGYILITTGDVTVQLSATGTDVINSGQVGAGSAGGAITIPADTTTVVQTSGVTGATAFTAPLGPLQYAPLSWGVGIDLSTNTGGIEFVRFATPRVVYGVKCKNDTLAGAAQTMTFKYQTDAGGVIGAGTTISSAPFDMNANLGVEQTVALTSSPLLVPAAYSVGSTVSGSATAGSGRCQYTYR